MKNLDSLISYISSLGIANDAILAAMARIPRDQFVPLPLKSRAFNDHPLPIGKGQTVSQPRLVAEMIEWLKIDQPHYKILEIGTGSGYQTAILAQLTKRLYSVERHADLLAEAQARLAKLTQYSSETSHNNSLTPRASGAAVRFLGKVQFLQGDGANGWSFHAPYDRIIVTAAAARVPLPLLHQLSYGGRMIIPLAVAKRAQSLFMITRLKKGTEKNNQEKNQSAWRLSDYLPQDRNGITINRNDSAKMAVNFAEYQIEELGAVQFVPFVFSAAFDATQTAVITKID